MATRTYEMRCPEQLEPFSHLHTHQTYVFKIQLNIFLLEYVRLCLSCYLFPTVLSTTFRYAYFITPLRVSLHIPPILST